MIVPMRKCFCFFSLRQGTVMVSIVVLLLSVFCLFLLLLGSAHAHQMAAISKMDIERESDRSQVIYSDFQTFNGRPQNGRMLMKGHNLAVLEIAWLYVGVALASVHLVLSMLLLYGAVMRVRQCLLPWMFTTLVGLLGMCTSVVVSMFFFRGPGVIMILVAASAVIALGSFMLLVVYSHYIELGEMKNLCSTAHYTYKDGYIVFSDRTTTV